MEKSRAAFQKMLTLAKQQKDREAEVEALFRLGWVAFYSHRPRSAEHFLSKAMARSHAEGLSPILLKAVSFLGQLHAVLGRLKKARPLLIHALDLSNDVKDPEGKSWSLAFLIQYYNWTGEFGEALALSNTLREHNETLKSPYFDIMLDFRQGLVYGSLGQLEMAEKILNSGLGRLEEGDDQFWRPRLLNTMGWIRAEGGDLKGALELNVQALNEALPTGDAETINNAIILAMTRPEMAGSALNQALALAKKMGTRILAEQIKQDIKSMGGKSFLGDCRDV